MLLSFFAIMNFSFLRQTPVLLLFIAIMVFLWGQMLPLTIIQGCYTISIFFKDSLLWVLPLAIASFIATTILGFREKAVLFIGVLLIFEGASNTLSVIYAYGVGNLSQSIIPFFPEQTAHITATTLMPSWSISAWRPAFWAADKAVFFGVFLGLWAAYGQSEMLSLFLIKIRDVSRFMFAKIFMPLIPIYVLGFLLQMNYSGLLHQVMKSYSGVFILLICAISLYILGIFIIAAGFEKNRLGLIIRHIWPTGVIAFSAMSSAATMPFTIAAAEKNLQDPKLAGLIIPATTNIQQVGDCIANALLCLVLLKTFGKPLPEFGAWIVFTSVFVLARFTTVGILGGAIFIMVPIYEQYLGFTPEMVSLIIALNVVLDPLITAANVMANGGLCVVFEKVWRRLVPAVA